MRFRFDRYVAIYGVIALGLLALGPTSGAATQTQTPPNIDTLPEGVPPRDNESTGFAELALARADRAVNQDGPGAGDDDYIEALEHAMTGLTADPGNPLSFFQAGRAHLGLGDFTAADSMFTKAVELHPRYVVDIDPLRENAWIDAYNAGLEAMNSGDTGGAVFQWDRAGTIFKKRPEALLNLGNLRAAADPETGIRAFSSALEILTDPGNRALQDSATVATWDENAPIARLNLAVLYLQAEDWQNARPHLDAVLRNDPENGDALSYLSVALTGLGLTDSAAVISERLMGTGDAGTAELAALGSTFYQAGNYVKAADAFMMALNRVPQHRDAAYNYAQSLYMAQDWAALEQASIRLRELDPQGIGWIRFGVNAYNALGRDTGPLTTAATNLKFEVDRLTYSPAPEGATVGGVIIANTIEQGTEVELRFHFYGENGEELGSESVKVRAGAPGVDGNPGEEVQFGVQFESDDPVIGYRYEVVGG